MKIILASGSPRRRELMEMLGVACEVQASGAEEVVSSSEPEKVVEELSRLKCLDVAEVTEGDSSWEAEGEYACKRDDETVAGEGASGVYWGYDCGESREREAGRDIL